MVVARIMSLRLLYTLSYSPEYRSYYFYASPPEFPLLGTDRSLLLFRGLEKTNYLFYFQFKLNTISVFSKTAAIGFLFGKCWIDRLLFFLITTLFERPLSNFHTIKKLNGDISLCPI